MAYSLPLGQRVSPIGINRVNVADGYSARALLLGTQVYAKQCAWDDTVKRNIEVDQDAILKYRFERVLTYYYIIVARLNTDLKGKVVGEDITVEYLRLSETQYEDFATALEEQGTFTSLLLKKVTKKGESGKDYSYVDVTLSNYNEIPQSVYAKIEKMQQTDGFLDGIWNMIDVSTSITVEQYEEKLKEIRAKAIEQPAQSVPQQVASVPRPQIPQPQQVNRVVGSPVQQRQIQSGGAQRVQGAAVIRPKAQEQFNQLAEQEPENLSGNAEDFMGFDGGGFDDSGMI